MWLFSITWEGQLLPSHVFACQTPHLPQTKCQGHFMAPKEDFSKVHRTTWSTISLKSNCINKSPQVRANKNQTSPSGFPSLPSIGWLLCKKWLTTSLLCNSDGAMTEKMDSEGPDDFSTRDFPEGLRPPKNDMFLFWPRHWHEEWVLIWLERQITPMNGLLIFIITALWVNTLQFLGSKW